MMREVIYNFNKWSLIYSKIKAKLWAQRANYYNKLTKYRRKNSICRVASHHKTILFPRKENKQSRGHDVAHPYCRCGCLSYRRRIWCDGIFLISSYFEWEKNTTHLKIYFLNVSPAVDALIDIHYTVHFVTLYFASHSIYSCTCTYEYHLFQNTYAMLTLHWSMQWSNLQ